VATSGNSVTGYSAGPMALSLPLVFLIGLAFYTATVARQWKRFDRLSVAEFFAARYSPALGRVVSSLLLAAMAGFCATYVKSMALLFVPFAPAVPPPWLGAALTAITLAIVLPGGLLSVVRADVIAFLTTIVMLPGLFALGLWRSTAQGGLASGFAPDQLVVSPLAQWTHPALPFWFVSTLIVLTCATYIAAPWYGQKIFAARNERTTGPWPAMLSPTRSSSSRASFTTGCPVACAASRSRCSSPPPSRHWGACGRQWAS
jgi:solute:Na+ symporter, SSS family